MTALEQTVLRTPSGGLVEGTERDGVWTPAAGLGLALTVEVLLANGWERA